MLVYLLGKPAQLPLVVNFVIVAVRRCLLPFTAAYANVVFIIIHVLGKCLVGHIAVPIAGGTLCRFVNRVSRSAVKHRGFVRFARVVRVDTLPPNLRDSCAAKVFLQLVRHLAVLELEFVFGCAICAFGSIANSFCTCPRKVIAVAHSAAAVIAAHAADKEPCGPCANLAGVIAFFQGAVVLTAHTAEIPCAGNRTGVIASLYDAVAVVIAAHAADIFIAGNLAGVVAVQYKPCAITILV